MCECNHAKLESDVAYLVSVVKKLEEGVALAAQNPMLKSLGIKL